MGGRLRYGILVPIWKCRRRGTWYIPYWTDWTRIDKEKLVGIVGGPLDE